MDLGLQSQPFTPYEVIKKHGDDYNAYAVNKIGLPELTPKRMIEVNKQPDVFGVLLLPSIRKIKFELGHPKLKDILHVKDTPDSPSGLFCYAGPGRRRFKSLLQRGGVHMMAADNMGARVRSQAI